MQDTMYAYAVGRIRAVEKRLLDRVRLERMIDAKTAEEAFKMLSESGYGLPGENVECFDYEKLLIEEQKKVYKLLREIAPEPEIFNLFLYNNDYHNLKVILKAEFLGKDYDELLVESGTLSYLKLKSIIKDRNFSSISKIMRDAILECYDVFSRLKDPQLIDLILDKASYNEMAIQADNSNNKFLKNLVTINIDLINIKSFLRIKKQGKTWDFLKKVLLENGSLNEKFFIELLDAPIENFIDAMKFTKYKEIIESAGLEQGIIFTKLEKLCDEYQAGYIKSAKFVSLGIEPLISYLINKENEIKAVRIIMIGKINNLSNDIIKERLRSY